MRRQSPRQSVLHTLLSVLTRKAPEQAKQHVQPPRRPAPDDRDAWQAYWKELGQPWRTEPEIDEKRQKYLAGRRITPPNIERSIYPFKDVKLNRADVEWLLATHQQGRGPVDWNGDPHDREGKELDLRGADLRRVDLSRLPLTMISGGLIYGRWSSATPEQREAAAMHLEKANLTLAHLEGATLNSAHLEGADLSQTSLQDIICYGTHLQGTKFFAADLAYAWLTWANLGRADLRQVNLEHANLEDTHLENANLGFANLERAWFKSAHLEGADLNHAHLEGANLTNAHLEGAILQNAFFDRATRLEDTILSNKVLGSASFADVHWGDVNLTVVKWSQVQMLGDESLARQKKRDQKSKKRDMRLLEYEKAARANRQLALVLQAQGFRRDPARFAYRAEVLEKHVFRLEMIQHGKTLRQRIQALGFWLFSWFLYLLAGYGYRPLRSFLAYLLVIGTFMALYLLLDPHLTWYEAIVVSMTAFHGRGFSPSPFSPGDPLSIASAVEAFVGLIIEVIFIATLTRRFFG